MRKEVNGSLTLTADKDAFISFTFIKGHGYVNDIPYQIFDTFFLPYGKECVIKGDGVVIISTL